MKYDKGYYAGLWQMVTGVILLLICGALSGFFAVPAPGILSRIFNVGGWLFFLFFFIWALLYSEKVKERRWEEQKKREKEYGQWLRDKYQ